MARCAVSGDRSGGGGGGARSSAESDGGGAAGGGARPPKGGGGGGPAGDAGRKIPGFPAKVGGGGGGESRTAPGNPAGCAPGGCAGSRRKESSAYLARRRRSLRWCARVGRPGCGAPAAAGVEVGRRGGSAGTSRGVGGVAPAAASARGRSCAVRCRLAGGPASSGGGDAEGGSGAERGEASAAEAAGPPRAVRRRARKLRRSFPARAPFGAADGRLNSLAATLP